jgi:PAS domain S-box-containing protein
MTPSETQASPERFGVKEFNEYVAAAGATVAIIAWFWRKAISEAFRWLWNLVTAPNRIADIAEIVRAHDVSIRTSVARSRISWDNLTSPVWESDAEGRCVFVNAAFLALVGRRHSEMMGMAWTTLVHPGDRDQVTFEWTHAIRDQRDFELRYRWVTHDGTVLHIKAVAKRLMDERDMVLGWVGFATVLDVEATKI